MIEKSIMTRRKTDKTRRQYSIRPDLVKKIQLEAIEIGCFDSAVVEKALELYFGTEASDRRTRTLGTEVSGRVA